MTDEQVNALLIAMLGVAGLTARYGDPERSGAQPLGWVPWLVRSGLCFDRSNLGSDQARARALFVDLLDEADPSGDSWLALPQWEAEDLAPIADQFAYGYAMGAFSKALFEDVPTNERFIGIVPDDLLSGNMAGQQVKKLIGASSAAREEFAARFAEDDDIDHLLWDRTPFEQCPFLRLGDGRLVLLSPRFLFDESRDADERVGPDDWHATPHLPGFVELDAGDSLRKRRRWYTELNDRGMR